jgi:hypothetical protein
LWDGRDVSKGPNLDDDDDYGMGRFIIVFEKACHWTYPGPVVSNSAFHALLSSVSKIIPFLEIFRVVAVKILVAVIAV